MSELCSMLIVAWLLLSIVFFIGAVSAVSAGKSKHGQHINRKKGIYFKA